jgi:serine/threonine protein kinase
VDFDDFEFVKALGQGAYGGVYLVKKKNTNDLFAMKCIDCSGKVKHYYYYFCKLIQKMDKKYLESL